MYDAKIIVILFLEGVGFCSAVKEVARAAKVKISLGLHTFMFALQAHNGRAKV